MKNWKTSLGGLLAGLAMVLGQVALLFDGKPDTMPDLSVLIAAVGMLGIGFAATDAK